MVKGDWRKADSKIESSVGQLMRSLIDEGKVSEGIWVVLELSDHGELGKILAKGAEIEVARAEVQFSHELAKVRNKRVKQII